MQNKILINKLKDNAELAWASYGYFHLANPNYDFNKDEIDKERLEYFRKRKAKEPGMVLDENTYPAPSDILNIEHKYFRDEKTEKLKNGFFDKHFLGGDFTPLQAKNFFERYDLLIHQPNTDSGFSATLFGEKRKQKNTETKEIKYTNEHGYINYILAIRGTEPSNVGDINADVNLTFKNLPKKQYLDMLLFYYQCIGKIPFYVELDSIPKDKNSQDYKLLQKLYQRSKDSKYKPYINPSLLKDSTKSPFIESRLESKKAA